jgi:hypothetical protein
MIKLCECVVQRLLCLRRQRSAIPIAPVSSCEKEIEKLWSASVAILAIVSFDPAATILERRAGPVGGAPQPFRHRVVDAFENNPACDAVAQQVVGAVTLLQAFEAPFVRHRVTSVRLAPARNAGTAFKRAIAASARTATGAKGRVISEMTPNTASPIASEGLPR